MKLGAAIVATLLSLNYAAMAQERPTQEVVLNNVTLCIMPTPASAVFDKVVASYKAGSMKVNFDSWPATYPSCGFGRFVGVVDVVWRTKDVMLDNSYVIRVEMIYGHNAWGTVWLVHAKLLPGRGA